MVGLGGNKWYIIMSWWEAYGGAGGNKWYTIAGLWEAYGGRDGRGHIIRR